MPLPNQNWIVDQRKPLLSPRTTNGNAPLPSGITSGDQGYTRMVQPNELASTHMEQLGRGDNRILQQARARGVRAGASRGGINSNLAAAGGEEAWLGAAGDVAMQQAGAYGTAAGQNLSSLANQRISAEGNQTSETVAGIGAGASMYNSDNDLLATREGLAQSRDLTLSGRDWESGEAQRGRDFTSSESQRDRDFTTGRDATQFGYNRQLNQDQFGYDQQARDNDLIRTVAGETFSRFLDDPETWDEYSQSGAIELFRRLFDQSRAPRGGGSTQPITPGGP
jgi:hypothetical protein